MRETSEAKRKNIQVPFLERRAGIKLKSKTEKPINNYNKHE